MIIIPTEYHMVTTDLMGDSLWVTLDPIESNERRINFAVVLPQICYQILLEYC